MNTNEIAEKLKYEEYFKIFRKKFPYLNRLSVSAKMMKLIADEGPLTWKQIQEKTWKYKAHTNIPIDSPSYGIDLRDKCDFMLIKSKDENDKRKIFYEVNEIGKAFVYYIDGAFYIQK